MIYADLVEAHKAQLGAKVAARFTAFDDADFARHLAHAARRISDKRPRVCIDSVALSVGVSEYPAPAGIIGTPISEWGISVPCYRLPYDVAFIGFPPLIARMENAGSQILRLSNPPTAAQIAAWGADLVFRYWKAHVISSTEITVDDADQGLVLLAALIEAMRELATDTTVVQLQKGLGGLPTAGTPAYLYEKLLLEFGQA